MNSPALLLVLVYIKIIASVKITFNDKICVGAGKYCVKKPGKLRYCITDASNKYYSESEAALKPFSGTYEYKGIVNHYPSYTLTSCSEGTTNCYVGAKLLVNTNKQRQYFWRFEYDNLIFGCNKRTDILFYGATKPQDCDLWLPSKIDYKLKLWLYATIEDCGNIKRIDNGKPPMISPFWYKVFWTIVAGIVVFIIWALCINQSVPKQEDAYSQYQRNERERTKAEKEEQQRLEIEREKELERLEKIQGEQEQRRQEEEERLREVDRINEEMWG